MSQPELELVDSSNKSAAPGARLGPGSLLWRIATDWRSGLPGLSAGIMQLMWPHLGQGVEDHSAFFTEPWDRINRSVPQIWATILADDAEEQGRRIRDLHKDIKGVDRHGDRYHALDPDTFWWAHATFTWEMFETARRWNHRGLSKARKERLYQETVTWYRRYGVSDRPVPPDYRSFKARFNEICANELEMTPSAQRALDMALADRVEAPMPSDRLPKALAELTATGITPVMRALSLGGLPPILRSRFDIPFSLADEAVLAGLTLTVRNIGQVLPSQLTRDPYLRSLQRMGEIAAPHPAAA